MSTDGTARFGVIGLGVMGRGLALNVEEHGVPVAVWNLEPEQTAAFAGAHPGRRIVAAPTLAALVRAVERPRRLMMLITAGPPVDETIGALRPLLDPGDVLVDGGNSHYRDTDRRETALRPLGIHYVGCGVSGGEGGVRAGPSLMPGGSADAYETLRPVLEAIAARTEDGPCVTHVGPGGSGHFVKMVHNGIEYGDMQNIAEAYDLLVRGAALGVPGACRLFREWNEGPLESFLLEVTVAVCAVRDEETGRPLLELVDDAAGQKGTGRWAVSAAIDLGVPVPTIAAAVDARVLSGLTADRAAVATRLKGPGARISDPDGRLAADVGAALLASRVCAFAQGLALVRAASDLHEWRVDLSEIARIWKAGCIIRARLLDPIRQAYREQPQLSNLLLAPALGDTVAGALAGWRRAVAAAVTAGIPTPAFAASLAYVDALRAARLPQHLTQAQRDAFGRHTYRRVDRPGTFHTDWLGHGDTQE